MSDNLGIVIIAVASTWLAIGLVLSLVMGRRGHDSFGWLVTGTLMGPFGVALAVDARAMRSGSSQCRWRLGRRPPLAPGPSTSSSAATARPSPSGRWEPWSSSSVAGSAG